MSERHNSAGEAVEAALRAIEALEPRLSAWVLVDREGAIEAARGLDARPDRESLPLYGVTAGVKDIYDVAGLTTTLGAPPFFHHVADSDATAVLRLREAGAVILGKTHTTEFAYLDPSPARNPWNPDHTPGGSSSGSAAAVAAGMVPLALGTQTVGSVLRPAAYCGVVGLKPSHGRIGAGGVFPLAPSFDHPGIICRSVALAARALAVLAGYDAADAQASERAVDDYAGAVASYAGPPAIGLLRPFYAATANESVTARLDAVTERLVEAGASVHEIDLPATPDEIQALGQPVLRAEAASVHASRYREHPEEYRPNIRRLVESGFETSAVGYIEAHEALRGLRRFFIERLRTFDALMLPSAPDTAPYSLESTGRGILCAPASFTGLPAIALPSGLDAGGLPHSLQLIAGPFAEARLLAVAGWVERVLDFRERPTLALP